jgi:hypothetical protein
MRRHYGPILGGIDGSNEHAAPSAVQPARHEVVHQVVSVGDAAEDIVDMSLLVRQRDLPEAEIGHFAGSRHGE